MDNCLLVMAVTESLPVPAIYNLSRSHALWYFDKLIWKSEFLDLPVDIIITYLSDSMIHTSSEINVFIAAVNWLKHLSAERAQYVDRVLNTVRVETLSQSSTEKLLQHPYAKNHIPWSRRLRGRLNELEGGIEVCEDDKLPYPTNRIYRKVPYSLWRVGGMIIYDDHTEWATDISKLLLKTNKEPTENRALNEKPSVGVIGQHNGTVITHVPTLEQSLDEVVSGYKACMVGK